MIFALLSATALLLAQHPFFTYPFSLWVLLRRGENVILAGTPPSSIAVCICAYNEEMVIADRVHNLIALRRAHPGLELLFYVDCADDETSAILSSFGGSIRLVIADARCGKTAGMNRLLQLTGAEIVVFSDANVMFAPDAIAKLVQPFADPAVGCTCGHLRYINSERRTTTAQAGSLYWRLEEWIKSLESRTGSVMGADGSIFAIRRALHKAPPPHLIDDMFVSMSILCAGHRVVRVSDAVATEVSVSRSSEEFQRKVRIACQAFNVHRALSFQISNLPPLDLYKYFSHKLLRWFTIYLVTLSVVLGVIAVYDLRGAASAFLAIFAITVCSTLISISSSGPFGAVREVLGAFTATGIGVWKSYRGQHFQTWTPPSSARSAAMPPLVALETSA